MKNNLIYFYSDGSKTRGYGHLYRSLALYTKFLLRRDVLFLSRNIYQRKFFLDHGLPFIELNQFKPNNREFHLIVDSKEDSLSKINYFLENAKKKLCIDSYQDWSTEFDLNIIPSFYVRKELLKKNEKKGKVKHGRDFVILRKDYINNVDETDILITFGGSDPNDLTSKVLSYLTEKNINLKISAIIGPSFPRKNNYYSLLYPNVNFIYQPISTFKYIEKCKIVFTALGTTIQEIEFLGKKGIISFNYQSDVQDFNLIKSSSNNPDNWIKLGYYKNLNFESLKFSELDKVFDSDMLGGPKEWGLGWKSIIRELNEN